MCKLAAGGFAYLDRDDTDQFRQFFPMTTKASGCLETALSNVKEGVKTLVADFMVNRTQIDTVAKGTPYLTCCELSKEDMPWEQPSRDSDDEDGADDEEDAPGSDDDASGEMHSAEEGSDDGYSPPFTGMATQVEDNGDDDVF